MKPIRALGMAAAIVFLAGCSSLRLPSFLEPAPALPAPQTASKPPVPVGQMTISDADGELTIQTVEFRSGTSSATVERLAKRFGCDGAQGAGLVTGKGPVEVYRMKCENGTTFVAQCELRQCRPMR